MVGELDVDGDTRGEDSIKRWTIRNVQTVQEMNDQTVQKLVLEIPYAASLHYGDGT